MTAWRILVQYHQGLLSGLAVTLELCGFIWCIGLVGGVALGSAGHRFPRAVGGVARVGSFLLTGIPVLVLLFWLHYPAQTLAGIHVDGFYTTIVALGIVNVFAVGETVRHALDDFPSGYIEAALVAGLPPRTILAQVQLPIITRQVMPTVILIQVSMLQATLFASLISVDEVFRVAQRINAQIYQPVQVYTVLAVVFLVICLPLNGLAMMLRSRFRQRVQGD
jgi:ABC-type amino acid transport system permease subunit